MERVMLTLPDDLLQQVDAAARRLGKQRSQVVRQALRDWLRRLEQEEVEASMAEGYQALAQEAEATAAEAAFTQAAAAEGVWHWDE